MSPIRSDIFSLNYPFTSAAGVVISQITLQRLTVKDLRQAQKISQNPVDWDELLIARASGLLPEDLEHMDLADYIDLQARFQQITGLGKKSDLDQAGAGLTGEMVSLSAARD